MADTKITALATGTTVHSDDWLVYVDTHDTTMAASGTDKKVAPSVVIAGLPAPGSSGQLVYNSGGAFAGATKVGIGSSGETTRVAITAPGSPADGSDWYDATQLAQAMQRDGMTGYPPLLLFSQITNVTVTASGASTLVSTTSAIGTVVLPAGFLNVVGRSLRIKGGGYASTAASSQGTVMFAVLLGTSVVCTGVPQTQSAGALNHGFSFDVLITAKATGASGKLDCSGLASTPGSGPTITPLHMVNGTAIGTQTATSQVTLDLTAGYTLDFQISLSATGNSYTLTNLTVEAIP